MSETRNQTWQHFFKEVQESNSVDPQKYWHFREQYSPGYLLLNDDAVTVTTTPELRQPEPSTAANVNLLRYSSPFAAGEESTVLPMTMTELRAKLPVAQELFVDDQSIIFRDPQNQVHIVLLMPFSEMRRAVGVFDYHQHEQDFLGKRLWLSQTILQG